MTLAYFMITANIIVLFTKFFHVRNSGLHWNSNRRLYAFRKGVLPFTLQGARLKIKITFVNVTPNNSSECMKMVKFNACMNKNFIKKILIIFLFYEKQSVIKERLTVSLKNFFSLNKLFLKQCMYNGRVGL